MSTIHYNGYQGSVTFEDGALVLQVLHINDFISTECYTASDVQKTFESLVDDYIAACAEAGKQPDKPFKGSFNVRVSPDLHRQAAMAAADCGVSLNAWTEQAMQNALSAPRSLRRNA